jgi:hypothetical protein
MTIHGHNDLLPTLESILRESPRPLDCHELYEMESVRAIAQSVNRVSDYLGVLFRKGLLSRVPSDGASKSRARWQYMWKDKELPEWKKPREVLEYRPKTILNRPNIYISEEGEHIHIEMPHLSITIKKK